MNLIPGRILSGSGFRFEAKEGGITLPLQAIDSSTAPVPPADVVLGIRPEHLQTVPPGRENGSDLKCRVDMVELLGGEALVHLRFGQTELTGRWETRPVPQVGSELLVSIPPDRIHLFNAESGDRL